MQTAQRFLIALSSTLALTVGAPIAAGELPLIDEDEQAEKSPQPEITVGKRDDWMLNLPPQSAPGRLSAGHLRSKNSARLTGGVRAPAAVSARSPSAAMAVQGLGLAVGGAGDVNNFRENIQNGYLPLPTDITTEGLYYDYFFDTGKPANECRQLFCPTYSLATTADPISGALEYYMAVGLQSNLKVETFKRKKLNLVVVLDISGSMKSPFNRYHYDRRNSSKPIESDARQKVEVAREAVQNLTRHLRDDDRFGMVVFNDRAHLAKPLNRVDEIDMDKIRSHINKLPARGGTNFAAGYKMGAELLAESLAEHRTDSAGEYENRIIYLTDAMPNRGQLSEDGLFGMTEKSARQNIHSTFVGIGVDFNSALIEAITKVRGANYFSVHSGESFNDLLDKDFDYMVTPMVFDLSLRLVAGGVTIDKVYGSPQADQSTGQVMRVSTLFPSRMTEQAVKGGLVLLKLSGKPAAGKLSLTASYEKRDGSRERDQQTIRWPSGASESTWFASSGVRKGILLTRYSNLLTHWILTERASTVGSEKQVSQPRGQSTGEGKRLLMQPCPLSIMPRRGICLPPPKLGPYERQSRKLRVDPGSAQTLETFLAHLRDETRALNDKTLRQEAVLIEKLLVLAKGQTGAPGKRDDWKLQ